MIDRPASSELRRLVDEVRDDAASPSYFVRIADNLERMLAREVDGGSMQRDLITGALRQLFDSDGDIDELSAELDRRLRSRELRTTAELRWLLMADVERRLEIARPEYL